MGLLLMTISKRNFFALWVINSCPLKPVKHDEKAYKVNEAVGGDHHSMKVWEAGWWFYQHCHTRQNNHANYGHPELNNSTQIQHLSLIHI